MYISSLQPKQNNFRTHPQLSTQFPSAHRQDPAILSLPTSGIVILGTTKDGVCTSSIVMIKNREVVGWLFCGSWALYVLVSCCIFFKCDGITLHLLHIFFQMICWLVGMDHQHSTCNYVGVEVQRKASKISKQRSSLSTESWQKEHSTFNLPS